MMRKAEPIFSSFQNSGSKTGNTGNKMNKTLTAILALVLPALAFATGCGELCDAARAGDISKMTPVLDEPVDDAPAP